MLYLSHKNNGKRHLMTRLRKIQNEFKLTRQNLDYCETDRERWLVLSRLIALRGQHREAVIKIAKDRAYAQSYRDNNVDRLREYHMHYARKRRAKEQVNV
jgi:hypothetical protein